MKQRCYYHPILKSTCKPSPTELGFITNLNNLGWLPYHANNEDYLFINWQPLFDWLNLCLHTNVEFSMDFSAGRPQIVSPDLTDKSGVFSAVVRETSIDFFTFNGNADNFWGNITLCYRSWSGGSNGMQLGNVWYNCKTQEWKFETCKERTLAYEQNGNGIL